MDAPWNTVSCASLLTTQHAVVDSWVQDHGRHVICAKVTQKFLEFSRSRGNDLITPAPHYNFPGLKDGDKWCLCAMRWAAAQLHCCRPQCYARGLSVCSDV
jgi:hypothetical protein